MSKKRCLVYLLTFIGGYFIAYLLCSCLNTDGWNNAVRIFAIYIIPIAVGGLFVSIVDSVSSNIHSKEDE
jgi:hypothetical protein